MTKFITDELDGIEWQYVVSREAGKYRVEITWALDRYKVSVFHVGHDCVYRTYPRYARTAVATANRLLNRLAKRQIAGGC